MLIPGQGLIGQLQWLLWRQGQSNVSGTVSASHHRHRGGSAGAVLVEGLFLGYLNSKWKLQQLPMSKEDGTYWGYLSCCKGATAVGSGQGSRGVLSKTQCQLLCNVATVAQASPQGESTVRELLPMKCRRWSCCWWTQPTSLEGGAHGSASSSGSIDCTDLEVLWGEMVEVWGRVVT